MELNRHQLREIAFQAIFSMTYQEEKNSSEALDYTLSLMDNLPSLDEEDYVPDYPAYLKLAVDGVTAKTDELDEMISPHLRGWKINRLPKSDLIILRLSLFEMLYMSDVPNKVSLNEALELAKTFSDEDSRRFINGVLSAIMAEIDSDKV